MSWLYSRALVEEYSEDICSDGEQSAPLSGNPTQLAYLPPDRMTAFSRLSRFGMTFKPLTESLGQDVLTSYLGDFPVRTFHQPDEAPASTELDPECGVIWRESLAKYDRDTCTWKIVRSSLLEESTAFSGTWPKWGLMHDGVSYRQHTLALRTNEIESGLWPTPVKSDYAARRPTKNWKGTSDLPSVVWTRNGGATNPDKPPAKLNEVWTEWLMGWPLGWTDLKPLAMDKYRSWQQQHGGS